jgi:hypothetical protein
MFMAVFMSDLADHRMTSPEQQQQLIRSEVNGTF